MNRYFHETDSFESNTTAGTALQEAPTTKIITRTQGETARLTRTEHLPYQEALCIPVTTMDRAYFIRYARVNWNRAVRANGGNPITGANEFVTLNCHELGRKMSIRTFLRHLGEVFASDFEPLHDLSSQIEKWRELVGETVQYIQVLDQDYFLKNAKSDLQNLKESFGTGTDLLHTRHSQKKFVAQDGQSYTLRKYLSYLGEAFNILPPRTLPGQKCLDLLKTLAK